MIRVLFICHGNICRSPIAEAIMKKLTAEAGISNEIMIHSKATSREEEGNSIYGPARKELEEHHVAYNRNHKATVIEKSDYEKYDYLICMDERNVKNLLRKLGTDPDSKVYKLLDFTENPQDIEDPYYTGNYRKVWNQIESGCRGLLKKLTENDC